jgi:hypothetical protein
VSERPLWKRRIGWGVAAALIYGSFLTIVFLPMKEEIQQKTRQMISLQEEVERGKVKAIQLPELRREIERQETSLREIASRLFPDRKPF